MKATGPNMVTRVLVFERSNQCCERCGHLGQQIHHRLPRRMGGTKNPNINSPANLVMLCNACHTVVESSRTRAEIDGYLIPMNGNPATIPIRLQRGYCFLTNEGGYE